jgi:hypothetical protein
MNTTIPGNKFSEKRIYSDTSKEWLEQELRRVVDAQAANMRSNPRYTRYIRTLRNAIAAR